MTTPTAPAIDQLKELPLPVPPFGYFPQTWGWVVLLLAVLVLAAIWGALRWRRWQRDRYRHEALAHLDLLGQALDDRERRLSALRELPELLKRVALSMPDAPPVARLGGQEWQAFLAQRSTAPLPEDFAARLFAMAYAPDAQVLAMPDAEVRALFTTSRQWIEAHHVAV
ncbi:DUF4381 domain-containing protein [Metapseudomonas lalkuanensis]|uniref:DUF4381 domain-containing protein n=1 Tax=Metapseudomonas lalkuanensis TaxID=2604832 RepID=UPI001CF36599|nr:DUF4381 domain-containing protein [Pseudomonas lalkuanensis]UCO95870.1 DUF4381 domain-containing protein [Pseudomonas lalkuanensis]